MLLLRKGVRKAGSAARVRRGVVSILFVIGMGCALSAQAIDFQTGLWRFTVRIKVSGVQMPEMAPHSYDYCITRKDILHKLMPPGTPCTVQDMKTNGNEITWRLACSGSGVGQVTGRGRVQFRGTSLQGVVIIAMSYPKSVETTQYLSGKRMGECPPISSDPRDGGLRRYVPEQ